MYSKELEELIESVLADGVITDQERAVLRKRAQASGEDPDEVMIVVEGRLAKMKKEAKPTKEKRGNVVYCPNCGAIIEAGAVKCKECGYVFTNVKVNSSAERFAADLAKLFDKNKGAHHDYEKEEQIREINEFIKNFPLPTTKEDMLEFIASMDARRRNVSEFQDAYGTKYKECVTKAKVLFTGDEDLNKLLSQTEKIDLAVYPKKVNLWFKNHKKLVIAIIAVLLILKLGQSCWHFLNTDIGDQNWYEVSDAIKDNDPDGVVTSLGDQTDYSVEKHQGEIASYIRKLVKDNKIEEAEDIVYSAKAIAPKVYVAKALYDYFVEHGNDSKALIYEKSSLIEDSTTMPNDSEN